MLFLRASARWVKLLCGLRLVVLFGVRNWIGERGSVRRGVVVAEVFACGLRTVEFTRTLPEGRTELGWGRSICGVKACSTLRVSRTLGLVGTLDDLVRFGAAAFGAERVLAAAPLETAAVVDRALRTDRFDDGVHSVRLPRGTSRTRAPWVVLDADRERARRLMRFRVSLEERNARVNVIVASVDLASRTLRTCAMRGAWLVRTVEVRSRRTFRNGPKSSVATRVVASSASARCRALPSRAVPADGPRTERVGRKVRVGKVDTGFVLLPPLPPFKWMFQIVMSSVWLNSL